MSVHRFNSFSLIPSIRTPQNGHLEAVSPTSSRPPTYNSVDDALSASSIISRDNDGDASLRNGIHGMLRANDASPRNGSSPRINRRESMLTISARVPSGADKRYLYYRVYTADGEMPSRNPINKKDPSLTRIKALTVAPPHTVASIKRCLCAMEKIGDYNGSKIFADLSSEDPLEEGHIQLMTYEGPGAKPDWPMVLVRPPLNQVIRVKYNWTPVYSASPKFLTIKEGDILHTDGIIKSKTYSGRRQDVYKAVDHKGFRGYLLVTSVEFAG